MKNKQANPDIEEIRIQASKVFDEFSGKLKGKPPRKAISGSYQDALDYKDLMQKARKRSLRVDCSRAVLTRRTFQIQQMLNQIKAFD